LNLKSNPSIQVWSRVFLPTGLNKLLASGSGLPSGLSGLPFGTARIQIPNENGQYKRFPTAYCGINNLYRTVGLKPLRIALNRSNEKRSPT
jgi:hypothetical protein